MKTFLRNIRQHLGLVVAATAACLVLVGGILVLTLMGGGTSHAAGSSTTATTTPNATAPPAKAKHRGVHGTVAAISGTTWTVTVHGAPVTVIVSPNTRFGTKAAPLTAAGLAVGDQVTVLGPRSGQTITATRITRVRAAQPPAPTTVPSPPTSG